MKHCYKVLIITLFLPAIAYSQSNYRPGYVITLKGDTLHGFINYKEWENNPSEFSFKAMQGNAEAQRFTAKEIQYFQIDQMVAYQRYAGEISMDQTNVAHLTTGKDSSSKNDTVFLKIEQRGPNVILYSYTDDMKRRYFIGETYNNIPRELIYRTYNINDGNYKNIIENKYIGQLYLLTEKYHVASEALTLQIEKSAYDQDLILIARKINHSSNEKITHHNPSSPFYIAISAGPNYIKPSTNDLGGATVSSSEYSYIPRLGFGFNAYTNPDVGRLVFRGEIALSAVHYKTYYSDYYYLKTQNYFLLDQYTLSFDPQILYNFYNTDAFKFYLAGGASINLSTYRNNKAYNPVTNTLIDNNIQLSGSWVSIPFSAGVTLNKKLGIFVTYTLPTIISAAGYEFHSTEFGISYTFIHKK